MFFILSKALYLFIQPINWVIGLMIYSLFTKKPVRKRYALITATCLALFFTNRLIYNQFIKLWEVETITADQLIGTYDIGILLGGFSNSHTKPDHDRFNINCRGNRFLNAYELYASGKIKKLLITGGSGDLLQKTKSEGIELQKFLLKIGVPAEDIIVEPDSRNTYENAFFSQTIISERFPSAKCLLITSASHMRRAKRCFEKAGIQFSPFSVDFITEKDRWSPEYTLIPDRQGFYLWEILIKEWVGYIAYWIRGYI